jgi:hypothetical protein
MTAGALPAPYQTGIATRATFFVQSRLVLGGLPSRNLPILPLRLPPTPHGRMALCPRRPMVNAEPALRTNRPALGRPFDLTASTETSGLRRLARLVYWIFSVAYNRLSSKISAAKSIVLWQTSTSAS